MLLPKQTVTCYSQSTSKRRIKTCSCLCPYGTFLPLLASSIFVLLLWPLFHPEDPARHASHIWVSSLVLLSTQGHRRTPLPTPPCLSGKKLTGEVVLREQRPVLQPERGGGVSPFPSSWLRALFLLNFRNQSIGRMTVARTAMSRPIQVLLLEL